MSEWQPIETAPKNETLLILAVEWLPGDWRIKMGGWRLDKSEWNVFGASWIPTHWMPAPEPPKGETDG